MKNAVMLIKQIAYGKKMYRLQESSVNLNVLIKIIKYACTEEIMHYILYIEYLLLKQNKMKFYLK